MKNVNRVLQTDIDLNLGICLLGILAHTNTCSKATLLGTYVDYPEMAISTTPHVLSLFILPYLEKSWCTNAGGVRKHF